MDEDWTRPPSSAGAGSGPRPPLALGKPAAWVLLGCQTTPASRVPEVRGGLRPRPWGPGSWMAGSSWVWGSHSGSKDKPPLGVTGPPPGPSPPSPSRPARRWGRHCLEVLLPDPVQHRAHTCGLFQEVADAGLSSFGGRGWGACPRRRLKPPPNLTSHRREQAASS